MLARRKAQVIYRDNFTRFVAKNPNGDCNKLSTCTTTLNCPATFPTYEIKYAFSLGKEICTKCCTKCTGCCTTIVPETSEPPA